jgi:hypothetical protein
MATAIRLAQDLAAIWERARPERRKQLVAELFEAIRIGGCRIVSVKPRPAVMPLIALRLPMSDQRLAVPTGVEPASVCLGHRG